MTQTEINSAIQSALDNLLNLNQMLFDYWYSVLIDESDNPIPEHWTEFNLRLMEDDVMYQSEIELMPSIRNKFQK